MTITLKEIKSEQTRLAEMIAAFEAQAVEAFHLPEAIIHLNPGERYAGLILGEDGEPSYHLIKLPGEQENIPWDKAMTWALEQAPECSSSLPTRREQSLLYANLKGEFKQEAYWSCETCETEAAWAWYQYFYDGFQGYARKVYTRKITCLRAVAVRKIYLEEQQ